MARCRASLCAALRRRERTPAVLKSARVRRRLPGMPERHAQESHCVLIKRYAGRRLYNTASAAYVTLEDLADMVLAGEPFVVREAETGADITRDMLDRLH